MTDCESCRQYHTTIITRWQHGAGRPVTTREPACEYGLDVGATECPHFRDVDAEVVPQPRRIRCPEEGCDQPLGLSRDGRARCAAGHAWKLRRSRGRCPECGERYATFGVSRGFDRYVYRLCECGWIDLAHRWVGPCRGNGMPGHGGQQFSPNTGRTLGL